MSILWMTYALALIVCLKFHSSYHFKVEEDNEPERDPEVQEEEEEEGEWSFEPADYQQLMEQQLDPIIPNYLDYKDYKEDYYPEA